MTFGVGVEGPSDRTFWNKVLHRSWPGMRFDIRAMKSRENLISRTPELLDQFRSSHYRGALIILDRDKDPCVTSVLDLFTSAMRKEARRPLEDRYLHVMVAVKGIESWYLADAEGLRGALPKCVYEAPEEAAGLNSKNELTALLQMEYGKNTGYNKVTLASLLAPHFRPERALDHSQSFRHFWQRLGQLVAQNGAT